MEEGEHSGWVSELCKRVLTSILDFWKLALAQHEIQETTEKLTRHGVTEYKRLDLSSIGAL